MIAGSSGPGRVGGSGWGGLKKDVNSITNTWFYLDSLPRCKNLWSFSLFSSYYFPWLYCVDFSMASLYSLFYVTREFQRFLYRGWAWFNAYCSLLEDWCIQNVITKKKTLRKQAPNGNVWEKLLEVPLSKFRQMYESMLQIYLSSFVTNPCFTIVSIAD